MGGSERDGVRRSGGLRVRTQVENKAIDLLDVQPFGSGLAQDLNDIRRLEEPESGGELALSNTVSNPGIRRGMNERNPQLGCPPSSHTMAC